MDWVKLLDPQALAALLPARYARFARPLQAGLCRFIAGLTATERQEILQAQRSLGGDASLSRRLARLARCSPVLHKLGQVLARDPRLPLELRLELQLLERLVPTLSTDTVRQALELELGPLSSRGIELARQPLAEGSVAAVIGFRGPAACSSSACSTPWPGVFKVLKPGIEARLHRELELLQSVGSFLDEQCGSLGIAPLFYEETFARVAGALRSEVRLEREQDHLLAAREACADESGIRIPRLLAPCSARVTAMEWIAGEKLDAASMASPSERRTMAELLIRALVTCPVFSRRKRALFHGDPHAGNLLRMANGQLALLDWSLAGHLDRSHRSVLSRIALAAISLRPDAVAALIGQLPAAPVREHQGLQRVAEKAVAEVAGGRLPGLSWLVALLDDAVVQGRLQLPADLILYRKALLSVRDQVAELTGEPDFGDRQLFGAFIRCFTDEWPQRWLRDAWDRDYPSGLGNADLLQAMGDLWLLPQRYWFAAWFQPGGARQPH